MTRYRKKSSVFGGRKGTTRNVFDCELLRTCKIIG
jgi:hypothetical protein